MAFTPIPIALSPHRFPGDLAFVTQLVNANLRSIVTSNAGAFPANYFLPPVNPTTYTDLVHQVNDAILALIEVAPSYGALLTTFPIPQGEREVTVRVALQALNTLFAPIA